MSPTTGHHLVAGVGIDHGQWTVAGQGQDLVQVVSVPRVATVGVVTGQEVVVSLIIYFNLSHIKIVLKSAII